MWKCGQWTNQIGKEIGGMEGQLTVQHRRNKCISSSGGVNQLCRRDRLRRSKDQPPTDGAHTVWSQSHILLQLRGGKKKTEEQKELDINLQNYN